MEQYVWMKHFGFADYERRNKWILTAIAMLLCRILLLLVLFGLLGAEVCSVKAEPRRILLDTDVDTDDLFALLYLLKQNRSEIELQVLLLWLITEFC